jgi:hypothetical protein
MSEFHSTSPSLPSSYTSQRWGIATPKVVEDRSDTSASETTRRCTPSNRCRTPTGSSLRTLGDTRQRSRLRRRWKISRRSHNRHPLPSRHGTVETPPVDKRHPPQATGTAGRLRSGDVAPVLHDLRRRDPSAEMCIKRMPHRPGCKIGYGLIASPCHQFFCALRRKMAKWRWGLLGPALPVEPT